MANNVARAVATWFGCGLFPVAPGTVGSAAAIAIAIVLQHYGAAGWHFVLLAAAVATPAVWSSGVAARESKRADPSFVVVDEVVGQWIALGAIREWNWKSYLAAFLLFRAFDIWKPPPVRQLERLHAGLGIVADDVMAGIYAAVVLLLAGVFGI
jgi:phosphatidylglycerophosphatase A